MTQKLIYKFQSEGEAASNGNTNSQEELIGINDQLHGYLKQQKNEITAYHKKHQWERYKKMSNDYELVYSTNNMFPSMSQFTPISRSYFKLWEILMDMQPEIGLRSSMPKRCAFLADAPGGFVQATLNYRKMMTCAASRYSPDTYFAISLKPTNALIPNWKLTSKFCHENNIRLCTHTSGDMCDINVSNAFTAFANAASCDFITADGGFDFSSDFNNQETMSTQLIMSEIYTILRLQAPNGSCVLKVYDIHDQTTVSAMYLLSRFYQNLFAYKPLSSRPANSEKYIVATGFRGITMATDPMFKALRRAVSNKSAHLDLLNESNVTVPASFWWNVVRFNTRYIASQIMSICKTIAYIEANKTQEDVVDVQVANALQWCNKYQVPINGEALRKFKQIGTTTSAV